MSRQAIVAAKRVVGNNRQLIEGYVKERKRAGAYANVERDAILER
jgi:hypothetical protein